MADLSYDVVIATRNRPDALALSIPTILSQDRLPARLIVIDSSEDHAPIRAAVEAAVGEQSDQLTLIVEHSAPGLPYQRNRGLAHVSAPIVLFVDDDSLLHPGASVAILEVYERDTEGAISGVCGTESDVPPPGALDAAAYLMTRQHRTETRVKRYRNRIEKKVSPLKPALALGRVLNGRHAKPDWLAEMDVVPVEYMTGFRMSFRTEAIRAHGFDEALVGYALDEDVDASFSAMKSGLVVAARRSRIFHHRHPGGRGDPFSLARAQVLNRAYVLLKHATGPVGSRSSTALFWRRQQMFMLFKLASCLPGFWTASGRARIAGVMSGFRQAQRMRKVALEARPLFFKHESA